MGRAAGRWKILEGHHLFKTRGSCRWVPFWHLESIKILGDVAVVMAMPLCRSINWIQNTSDNNTRQKMFVSTIIWCFWMYLGGLFHQLQTDITTPAAFATDRCGTNRFAWPCDTVVRWSSLRVKAGCHAIHCTLPFSRTSYILWFGIANA